MNSRVDDALEVCLSAMQTGVDLETCLQLYPDMVDDLQPVLEAVRSAMSLQIPEIPSGVMEQDQKRLVSHARNAFRPDFVPADSMQRSLSRVLARADQLRLSRTTRRRPIFLPRLAYGVIGVLVVLLISLSGLMATSARALPGDQLYPVKRAFETLRLQLVPASPSRRALIEESYRQRRIDEIQELLAMGKSVSAAFEGVVTHMSPERWVVGDIPVVVTPDTQITGEIAIGMLVEVKGDTQPEGQFTAQSIALRAYAFIGLVEEITPDQWRVNGTVVRILNSSQISPGIQVGDQVTILAEVDDQGQISARAILIASGGDSTQTPTVSPVPSETNTLEPTPLPGPTGTPSPTQEPQVIGQIELTGEVQSLGDGYLVVDGRRVVITPHTEMKDSIAVGDVVKVHAEVLADGTLQATEVSLAEGDQGGGEDGDQGGGADHTPRPTESEEPAKTPEVTETPKPTEPPESTGTPEPTEAPNDTETPDHTEEPDQTETPEPTETP